MSGGMAMIIFISAFILLSSITIISSYRRLIRLEGEGQTDGDEVVNKIVIEKDKQVQSSLLKIDEMLKASKVDQNLLDNLGKGLTNLATSVVETNEYAKNVATASQSLIEMNKKYAGAMEAVKAMTEKTDDTNEYRRQVQAIAKNLAALNSVYEMELKDADSHVKAMNKFYENLTGAMNRLSKISDDSEKFSKGLNEVTFSLNRLNAQYQQALEALKR